MADPELVFIIDEAIKSMNNRQGFRSGFYLRAAYDYVHSIDSTTLEIALENYQELINQTENPED